MRILRLSAILSLFASTLGAQTISIGSITTTSTQAVITYSTTYSGGVGACTLQAADMDRGISIATATTSGGTGTVTVTTVAPHGLLPGAIVRIEGTGVWDGWQTPLVSASASTFTFASSTTGSATTGNVGVLSDDVNATLYSGSNLGSRAGNTPGTFVLGLRDAPVASDSNRYSRALQANARYRGTFTCGSATQDFSLHTTNIPVGDTHNSGLPSDPAHPGQYSYPTVQWPNQTQTLIDPVTGIRSYRVTGPLNTLASASNFISAFTPGGGWANASVPPTNASPATYGGTCGGSACPLFLRADTFTLSGGATLSTFGSGVSLESLAVTVNNAFCSTGSCSLSACLTINTVSCASTPSITKTLTGSAVAYTFGTQGIMDLWQPTGTQVPFSRADVSLASGTVNFTLATETVALASGNKFSPNWTAGSTIIIAGTSYTIASVQGPISLTLVSGPGSNLSGATYSAPNFGVLLTCTGQCSVGTTTFIAGSSPQEGWPADSKNASSPTVTLDGTTNGKPGYDVLIGPEIYWMAADGSQVLDLGGNYLLYNGTSLLSSTGCATSDGFYAWDPDSVNYPDTLYCLGESYGDPTRYAIFKLQYNTTGTSNPIHSAHIAYTPGAAIPACTTLYPVPCLIVTLMQPLAAQTVSQGGTAFNPDYAASGFVATGNNWSFGGTSPEGQLAAYVYGSSQDTPGWWFVYDLGNRQPMGVTGGMTQIAAASTYRKAPASWCVIHDFVGIAGGYTKVIANSTFSQGGPPYSMTLSSPSLPATGLDPCPANPFGVTVGSLACNTVTISGQPVSTGSPSTIQGVQQGDLIVIGSTLSGETVKVLTVPTGGGLTFTIQRGATGGSIVTHSPGATMSMVCGAINTGGTAFNTLTNFIADPLGANASWTTVFVDGLLGGGHSYLGGGIPNPPVTVAYQNSPDFSPNTLCPSPNQGCQQVRDGYLLPSNTNQRAISTNPPFAGLRGAGDPNNVDTHPGACFLGFCMDGRPLNGATGASLTFSLISGKTDLWKASGTTLNPKILPTFAYVGKRPLADVSGPSSTIADGPTDNYQYCYVNATGECVSGSSGGDVYVNAPFVTPGACLYPGTAVQGNDNYEICVGDLGAFAASINQWGYAASDLTGSSQRRLGPNYNQFNQFPVFWTEQAVPSGLATASNVAWLAGVRTDNMINVTPPYPSSDGVTRGTFQPVTVTVPTPQAGISAATAIVEFGYGDYANSSSYFNCTTRQETCVAVAATVNQATPFYYETTESGSYTGVTCTSSTSGGCPVAIPALGQRVLHYRYKYLNSGGAVVATGREMIVVTP